MPQNYFELTPVKFPESNETLGPRLATDDESPYTTDGKVNGMHYCKTDQTIVSMWKTDSIIARLRFLFTGKINLILLSQKQTPAALSIGNPFDV